MSSHLSRLFGQLLRALAPGNLTRAQKADLICDALAFLVLTALAARLDDWMVLVGFLSTLACTCWSVSVTRPRGGQ